MNFVLFLLITAVLVSIQCMIGGTHLAYALGPYAVAGGAALFSLVGFRRQCIKPSAACVGSALLLLAYFLGRAAFSPNPYDARADACMAIAAMIVYLITSIFLNQPRFRTGIALVLCALTTVQVLVGAIQFSDGGGFMLNGFVRPEIFASQASGLFTEPSHLAVYLEITGLFALSYTIWGRYSLAMKLLFGYLLLVCTGGLAITGSLSGYLGAVGGALVFTGVSAWVVYLYKEGQFPLVIIGSTLAIIAFFGATVAIMKTSTKLNERLNQISRVEKDVRIYHWKAAADQIKFAPVFGTGANTHPIYQRLFRRAPIQTEAKHAHSDYLEIVAQYGAVGGVLAAVFLLTHLVAGIRNIREVVSRRLMNIFGPPKTNSLALNIGALSATVALLIHSAFDTTLHTPSNVLVWAFMLGILSNPGLNRESLAAPTVFERALRGTLGALGAVLIAASATWYHSERLSEQALKAFEQRDFARAGSLAARAIQAAPANSDNYYVAGESMRNQALGHVDSPEGARLLDQATEIFRKGLERMPENGDMWIRLGQALDAAGKYNDAETAFVQGIAADPNLGILYNYYAEHLLLSGDPDGALECINTAKKLIGPSRKLSDFDDPLPLLSNGAPMPNPSK